MFGPCVMSIGPFQYLGMGEMRQGHMIADAATSFEQLGKRGTARQPASTNVESGVDSAPRLAGSINDLSRSLIWPISGAAMMPVRPVQDAGQREARQESFVPAATVVEKQFCQR